LTKNKRQLIVIVIAKIPT